MLVIVEYTRSSSRVPALSGLRQVLRLEPRAVDERDGGFNAAAKALENAT